MTSVSSISNSSIGVGSAAAAAQAAADKTTAEGTLALLCQDGEVIDALTQRSALYYLPDENQVTPILWALFATSDPNKITKDDVEKAVLALGGTRQGAKALWTKLDTNGEGETNAVDFIANSWLNQQTRANLPAIQDAVYLQLLTSGPSVPDALSTFTSMGGSGSLISGLGRNSNFINVFV